MLCVQEFDDARDADDAVYELNGKDLLGDRCVVAATRINSLTTKLYKFNSITFMINILY